MLYSYLSLISPSLSFHVHQWPAFNSTPKLGSAPQKSWLWICLILSLSTLREVLHYREKILTCTISFYTLPCKVQNFKRRANLEMPPPRHGWNSWTMQQRTVSPRIRKCLFSLNVIKITHLWSWFRSNESTHDLIKAAHLKLNFCQIQTFRQHGADWYY